MADKKMADKKYGLGSKITSILGRATSLPVGLAGVVLDTLGVEGAMKTAEDYNKETRDFRNRAWGINEPPPENIPAPLPEKLTPEVPVKKSGLPPVSTTSLPATSPETSGKDKSFDIYATLRDPKAINDRQFKKFVELYGRELPGIGFIEDKATGKVTRLAEKPAPPPGMNVTQANAAANMITAQAHAKTAETQAANTKLDRETKNNPEEKFYQAADKLSWTTVPDPDIPGQVKQIRDYEGGMRKAIEMGHVPPAGIKMPAPMNDTTIIQRFIQDAKNNESQVPGMLQAMKTRGIGRKKLLDHGINKELLNYYKY
jgi:hypothetical protein